MVRSDQMIYHISILSLFFNKIGRKYRFSSCTVCFEHKWLLVLPCHSSHVTCDTCLSQLSYCPICRKIIPSSYSPPRLSIISVKAEQIRQCCNIRNQISIIPLKLLIKKLKNNYTYPCPTLTDKSERDKLIKEEINIYKHKLLRAWNAKASSLLAIGILQGLGYDFTDDNVIVSAEYKPNQKRYMQNSHGIWVGATPIIIELFNQANNIFWEEFAFIIKVTLKDVIPSLEDVLALIHV
jgi:hypothetical protein